MTAARDAASRRWRQCLYAAVLALLVPGVLAGQTRAAGERQLTLDRITSRPALTGTAPSSPQWSPDSRRLAFLWNDAAAPQRDIWVVAAAGGAPARVTSSDADAGGISEFIWSADGASLVYLRDGEIHQMPAAGGSSSQLTRTQGSKSSLAASPDGRYLSWLQDGDLWLRYQQTGDVVRATHVGVPGPATVPLGTYNRPDVEFGQYVWGGGVPAYLWSPDSRHLALHYVDRRAVRKVPFPYYLDDDETTANVLRRGYPGDHDERRTLAIYAVGSGALRMLAFPDQGWRHINGYAWSADNRLLIDQLSDTQQDRWLHVADPAGSLTTLWHDYRESRVYSAFEATWAGGADPSEVLVVGDRDERYRLYRLSADGETPRALTPAAFDVGDVTLAGAGAARTVFFTSNQKNPYERHVYRMPLGGGPITPVTRMPGTHQPTVSPDGTTVAVLHSSDTAPTELYLVDGSGQRPERRVTTSPPPEFHAYRWAVPRYVTFKSRIDGYTLHARVLEPPDLDKGQRYPIVFGPVYSNTVRNRWAGTNAAVQQFLAVERGYIVVQVDVRGSVGYGREFREQFLMDYGGRDLEDLQSALEYLRTLPYADTERAGIWGSSYGGLLTTYMLFKKPGLFKAGVAAAAAVDPRFFGVDDVAITRLPNTHPEAYRRGSAAQYARNLQDPLLFIHGMQDDVVPFKTIVDLMEQLMLLGKDFDVALAPAATHGWSQREHYARFLYRKLVAHFDRHLHVRADRPRAAPRTPAGARR